ncbi:MAG: hypothetical protein ACPG77_18995, partial [Nannocystaceae bacterium]
DYEPEPELLPQDDGDVWESLGEMPAGGAAPLRPVLHKAYDTLLGQGDPTRNAVVVFADGSPNCSPGTDANMGTEAFEFGDLTIINEIMDAKGSGLRTFFVGIGTHKSNMSYNSGLESNWENDDAMMTLAIAGGTDNVGDESYYLIDSPQVLDFRMSQLARRLYCDVRVPQAFFPWEPGENISFEFEGDGWSGSLDSCAGGDGVSVSIEADDMHFNFCGEACDMLAESGGSMLVCVGDGAP